MGFSLTILAVFVTVTVGVTASYYALSGLLARDASLVKRRVEDEFRKGPEDSATRSPLFKSLDLIDLGQSPVVSDLAEASASRPAAGLRGRLQALLDQADLPISPRQLLFLAAGLGLALGLAAALFRGPLLGIPAAALGTAAPLMFVNVKRRNRREKFLAQLPNAFELMARILRSGQSVPQSLQAVADSFEGPIAEEFANCQTRQNLGQRPEVAFREMAAHTGILEVRIFVMAMLIHRQAGGNLSEVLERLASLIRARLRLRKQVRTFTAEGRLQGWTLMALPVLMLGVMMVINRPYAEVLFEHPSLLVGTVVSMLLGMVWIRKIVNFEV
ncbi:MAG: type II secretion system F family protein [Planctomycetes bacterium]|nr:type II secretion system F family protein [Planctomycetota bacterium]